MTKTLYEWAQELILKGWPGRIERLFAVLEKWSDEDEDEGEKWFDRDDDDEDDSEE